MKSDFTRSQKKKECILSASNTHGPRICKMLNSLNADSRHGLGMNLDKNKVMFNDHVIPEQLSELGRKLYI